MPRALWIHQNYVGARQAGNGRAAQQVAAWLERGWELDVVCTDRSYLGDDCEGSEDESFGGLRVHRLASVASDSKPLSYLRFCLAALRFVRRLPRPDVIFASSPPLPQLLPSMVLSALWRRPMVLEIRDLWPAFLQQTGTVLQPLLLSSLRWLEALAYRYAETSITVGPAYEPYLRAMGIPGEEILVCPTGAGDPPSPRATALSPAWRRELGIAESERIVVYAGSFNDPYPITEMLEAARHHAADAAPIRWVFAGNGVSRGDVEAAAAEHRNVLYLGSLPRNALAVVLAAADIAVVGHVDASLLNVTICGKLFDALSAAVPVLVIQDGQMGLLVRLARAGGVIPDASPGKIATAVRELAERPRSELRAMGECGRRWARRHFHAETHARAMVRQVESVLTRAPRSGLSRLMTAVAQASVDWARGRSQAALKCLDGDGLDETVRDATRAWLTRVGGGAWRCGELAPGALDSPPAEPTVLASMPERLEAGDFFSRGNPWREYR